MLVWPQGKQAYGDSGIHVCVPLRHGKVSGALSAVPRTVRVPCQAAFGTGLPINLTPMQRHLGHADGWAEVQLLLSRQRRRRRKITVRREPGCIYFSITLTFLPLRNHNVNFVFWLCCWIITVLWIKYLFLARPTLVWNEIERRNVDRPSYYRCSVPSYVSMSALLLSRLSLLFMLISYVLKSQQSRSCGDNRSFQLRVCNFSIQKDVSLFSLLLPCKAC